MITLIKFIGAWFCIVAAVVLILLGHAIVAQPVETLAVLSLAFAMAPSTW